MREVVKIPGDRCDGCVHTGVNEWDERVCYAFELPIGVSWKENKNTSRHRDCPCFKALVCQRCGGTGKDDSVADRLSSDPIKPKGTPCPACRKEGR